MSFIHRGKLHGMYPVIEACSVGFIRIATNLSDHTLKIELEGKNESVDMFGCMCM
jgi:hypothetical protein